VYPPTQGTAFLQGALGGPAGGRIFALRDDMPPNTGTPYGIADSVGFDFPPRDYLDLASGFGAELIASRNRLRFEQLDPRWLDLTSTRFVISREALPAASGLREVQPAGTARIYEYERAVPRAFVARRARVIAEPAAAFAALRQPDFDPRTEVVLDAAPSAELNPAADVRRDRVEIAEYAPNTVTIAANLAEAGVLVLTDAFYPGWQASVNGRPAEIVRANRAFRGVELPAGDHIVRFDYRPTSVPIGLALSAAAALVTAAFFVVGWMQRRPSSNVM
jgi:hypothetical protein